MLLTWRFLWLFNEQVVFKESEKDTTVGCHSWRVSVNKEIDVLFLIQYKHAIALLFCLCYNSFGCCALHGRDALALFDLLSSGFQGRNSLGATHLDLPVPTVDDFGPEVKYSPLLSEIPPPKGCHNAATPHNGFFRETAGLAGRFLRSPATSVRS